MEVSKIILIFTTMIKEITTGNKTLRIFADESPMNPREWDNLSKMICFHSRYSLGDKHDYSTKDYTSWDAMKKGILKKEKDVAVILPLYLYDHSGITMKTTPFSCRWDSGQVGFVIVTRKAIRDNWMKKRVTKKLIEHAERLALGEVETYDQYISGDVYRFEVEVDGEITDSCGGFYGSKFADNGILDHIEDNELRELLQKG